jgi:HNH endonuclease
MPTKDEIERFTRELIRESKSPLKIHHIKPFDNNQADNIWDVQIVCPECPTADISVLAEESAVQELIRLKIQEHLATH